MKTRSVLRIVAPGLALLPALLIAQPSAHYVPGVEGIKGASLPPPGFYLRDYNIYYTASQVNDAAGNSAGPPNFGASTYANVPRVLWISDAKLLGGSVGADALLPLVYQHARAGGWDSSTFGIGDFFGEATLSWHLKQFDFAAGVGEWAPTGDSPSHFPPPSTRAGLGYWTTMLTAGATWYADADKTWALSLLNRYEFNSEQRDTGITYGQAYTLEWGASKTLNKTIDLGVVGYYQQQVTSNSGGGSSSARNRVAAAGPEVSVVFPKPMLFVSLRYLYEFMAESRARGQAVALTLTKAF